MVGRQVVVWQHPACFLRGLQVTTEMSGRGKCKQTKAKFAVGEHRISAQAHTTTVHMKLSAAPVLLRPVYAALPEEAKASHMVHTIEGFEQLLPDQQRALHDGMRQETTAGTEERTRTRTRAASYAGAAGQSSSSSQQGDGALKKDDVRIAKASRATSAGQPRLGEVSKSTGRVCWRFAGKLCFGTLLSAKETADTCYARTHKGNIKTLAKGGGYWWITEA